MAEKVYNLILLYNQLRYTTSIYHTETYLDQPSPFCSPSPVLRMIQFLFQASDHRLSHPVLGRVHFLTTLPVTSSSWPSHTRVIGLHSLHVPATQNWQINCRLGTINTSAISTNKVEHRAESSASQSACPCNSKQINTARSTCLDTISTSTTMHKYTTSKNTLKHKQG